MSVVTDRRGRVPFALVGVLLLVGATAYASGLAARAPPTIDRGGAESVDAAVRDVRPALRTAVRDAARAAAANPVVEPANTSVGRVLNDSSPFVDSLRVRIAVAARAELDRIARGRGALRTTASLPAVESAADLRRAKRGIRVVPVRGNESLRVTIRNVTVRARRDGRVVADRSVNVSLVVSTPVLALHERVRSYVARLDRGVLTGPGLGRGLTARLYPVTWARAYARFGGTPIQDVLGNRHVELSTNGAMLDQQRAVFGRVDPDGARAVQVATARVGVTDVLGGVPEAGRVASLLRPNAVDDGDDGGFDPDVPDAPPLNASPNASADEAYLDLVDDGFIAQLRESYRLRATLRTRVREIRDGRAPPASPPGENWTLVDAVRRSRISVSASPSSTDRPGRTADASAFATTRRVVVEHAVTRTWTNGRAVRRTTATWADSYRVVVSIGAAYAPRDDAPDRPTVPVFARGGVLDSRNLGDLRAVAVENLLAANGGVDAVARGAVRGASLRRELTRSGTPSQRARAWVLSDLRSLRKRVANLTVRVSRRRVATGEANPAARLAATIRDRRTSLIDAPATYDGVADRARVSTRAAYLDAVLRALDARAAAASDRNAKFVDAIGDRSARGLAKLVAIGAGGDRERLVGGPRDANRTAFVPDGSPAYLTLSAVTRDHVPTVPRGESVHPLAARTLNWFALPYGDVVDGVLGLLGPRKEVSLAAAGQVLVAAERTPANGSTELVRRRRALRSAVAESVREVERRSCRELRTGTEVSGEVCAAAVDAASRRWSSTGHRALAVSNGSYAVAVGDELRAGGVDPATADEAAVRLRVLRRRLASEGTTDVRMRVANETATATRSVGKTVIKEYATARLENASRRAVQKLNGSSRLPAGLPVAPVPGYWYATVNGWTVTVRGEYQRFVVRAYAGPPDGTGGTLTYVRDASPVTLDVDGDGDRETLGTNERISFETGTTVVVAVPPGPPGVGDVDGDRDERSKGWPCPGAGAGKGCEASRNGE